jgi:hypothetical protein
MANTSSCRKWLLSEAVALGNEMGVDWRKIDARQFVRGLDVEAEHGLCDPLTNVTNDDPVMTAKIALAHLNEFPDYYTRLEAMEKGGELPRRRKKDGGSR